MKFERFSKLRKVARILIKGYHDRLESNNRQYIKTNKEYNEGEEVDLWLRGDYKGVGRITGNEIKDFDTGEIQPIINRIDENGNTKNTRWWFWYNYDKIKRR